MDRTRLDEVNKELAAYVESFKPAFEGKPITEDVNHIEVLLHDLARKYRHLSFSLRGRGQETDAMVIFATPCYEPFHDGYADDRYLQKLNDAVANKEKMIPSFEVLAAHVAGFQAGLRAGGTRRINPWLMPFY